MEKILILGMGGHANSVTDSLVRMGKYEIAGYVVNDASYTCGKMPYPILGCDNDLLRLYEQGIKYAVIGIGYMGNGNLCEHLYRQLKEIGYKLPVICDPSAIVAENTEIGEGTFIGKKTVINSNTTIGKMCIINTASIVEHDCYVGDYSHVAVGSILCGSVYVGKSCLIGANTTVIQEIRIGNSCVTGAGAVVIKNIPEAVTVVGVPAKIIK